MRRHVIQANREEVRQVGIQPPHILMDKVVKLRRELDTSRTPADYCEVQQGAFLGIGYRGERGLFEAFSGADERTTRGRGGTGEKVEEKVAWTRVRRTVVDFG
jgi:hypothetical protein